MTTKQPRPGPGRMQWNAGGWFGATFGSTLWLLLAAGMVLADDPRPGFVLLGCFVITNVIAAALWYRRDRFAPYTAFQVLFATIGAFAALAVTVLHRSGQLAVLHPDIHPATAYAVLLVVPAVMVLAHVLELAARPGVRG